MFSATNANYPMASNTPVIPDEQAISGAGLLASLEDLFRRHVVVREGVPLVLALWTINTYIFEIFDYCP